MSVMNSVTRVFDNLFTTTWNDRRRTVVDNIFQITPFWDMMIENGRIRERVPDGTHWEIPYRTGKQDQNQQYFTRGASFGRAEKETLTLLNYETKNFGSSIVRFWQDEMKNRGRAKVISYVDEMLDNTEMSMVDQLAVDTIVSNADPQALAGLDEVIPNDPTAGSVGGVTRAGNAWLQNKTENFTGTIATDLINSMRTMYNNCSKVKSKAIGRRAPNVILTTQSIHEELEKIAETLREIQSSTASRVQFGFGDLSFKGAEIFWDPNVPAGRMYFLNTATLELMYHPDAWFEMTPWKSDAETLDRTAQIVCVAEFICTAFPKNGVIYGID